MKIVSDFEGDYKDGYNMALNLEEFSNDDEKMVLFYGIQCGINKKALYLHEKYERKILLDLWSPCALFTDPNHFSILEGFDEVYSICPYTVEWTNERLQQKLMKYAFYPVNPKTINPKPAEEGYKKLMNIIKLGKMDTSSKERKSVCVKKSHEVCYVGGLYSQEHYSMIEIISKFKYIFVTQNRERKATHRKLSNVEKINQVAKCKMGICFNKLYPSAAHLANIKKYANWQNNKAFDHLSDHIPIAPQIKTRLHELALCKTLILCHRDPWNLVEDYYEPEKDFIYFDSVDDLKTLIPEILNNYEAYQHITDSAYNKVRNFSTQNLVDMIRQGAEFGHTRARQK
jgi:hypothetical protein